MALELAGLLDLLARSGMVTMVPAAPAVPALVPLVAGGPVKGSWWAHPAGKTIFALASALDDHADVLSLKLVAGKVTFVHRRLWPALLRCVTDPAWRDAAKLPAAAARLLASIEAAGELPVAAAAVKPLGLLVRTAQVHTESGRHEPVATA